MKPHIDQTTFGTITIDGMVFEHDVMIQLNGQVKQRKKKLSKAVYGTPHIISLAETMSTSRARRGCSLALGV
ncbi:MAG: hypothetical protein WCD86_12395 [Ktedonobacteraceae bacterium]